MHEGNGTTEHAASRWADGPTAKQRTAVQHAVSRLLDDLAPERTLTRADRVPVAVERFRSPRGCILQGAGGAVSVSWFPGQASDAAYGELQVISWRGVVSRPGATRRAGESAVAVRQVVLRPAEIAPNAWAWRSEDDTVYDAVALAAHCHGMLEDELSGAAEPTTPAR